MITTTAMTIALSARADISNLDWMTGCWALTGQEKGSIEQWSTPAGKTMLGFNRVVSAGQTIAFEFLRIVEEDEKAMILVASPSGQETASFRAIESSNSKVVFENSEHDFPQRIIYRLDENRNLVGRIEGTINGEARAVDFPMTRTSCDDDSNSQD
jgi:hypothetical protein